MIRRSVRVLLLALAVLLAWSGTVSANHDAPHGGGGCTDQGSVTGCYGGGGGGNDQAGGGGSGGKVVYGLLLGQVGGGGGGAFESDTSGGGGGGCVFYVDDPGAYDCGGGSF